MGSCLSYADNTTVFFAILLVFHGFCMNDEESCDAPYLPYGSPPVPIWMGIRDRQCERIAVENKPAGFQR
ncbi:hypothetical protein BGC31_13765 [Komagataeibacter xylinus]|nr:hypothetical protein GLUCORHAEAF1_14760 [Komagataeibacter rhaeticus AF1]RFP00935.1 hypothetical protein BFX83_02970 [Komagataeibacter xylinus]RFP01049.1 hypothetical protein BGC31_13765 [Komagataeibacter xylinus]